MYNWLQRLFGHSAAQSSMPAITPSAVSTAESAPMAATPLAAHKTSEAGPRKPRPISWLHRSDINAAFTNWLFDGNQHTESFTNPLENDILGALEKIVNSSQSGANLVRRMPGVIPQLLQSLRTEDFSGAELSRKISHDVVLVAAVIRIANSSVYNPGKPITSIEHAVIVLGQTGLRQLITSVAFQPIIDLNSGQFTKQIAPRLWEQSEKCGIVNRMTAQEERVDPFESFLAGLLQNAGLIVSLRVIDQMYDGKQSIGSESFCNALINYGRLLTCSIGKEWNFPTAVITAIAEQGDHRNANISSMGKNLATADYLSKIHMLNSQHRLQGQLATFTQDLSARQIVCLDELAGTSPDEG